MRLLRSILPVLVLILCGNGSSGGAAPSSDRLLQLENYNKKFRAVRDHRLAITPFDCGRIIVEAGPEYSVSVYSQLSRKMQSAYVVTYIWADHSLRDITDNGHHPERSRLALTHRIDRGIPADTAGRLRAVWTGMLAGPQKPRLIEPHDAFAVTDGKYAEFSIERSPRPLYGMLIDTDLLQRAGSNTKLLVEISDQLVSYCKAKSSERSQIRSILDEKCKTLLEQLKSGRRK